MIGSKRARYGFVILVICSAIVGTMSRTSVAGDAAESGSRLQAAANGILSDWASPDAYIGKPIPTGRNAYTQKQFNESLTAFYNRTLVQAYKSSGKRDPKWDDAAIRFLEDCVRLATDQSKSLGASRAELVAAGKAAVDLGCDDPVVLSVYGMALFNVGKIAESAPILEQSLDWFLNSTQPKCYARFLPYYFISAWGKLGKNLSGQGYRDWRDLAVKWIVAALRDGCYQPGEQRIMISTLQPSFRKLTVAELTAISEAVAKEPDIDPYVAKYINGLRYIEIGWAARGHEFADKVTEEGWKGFEENLTKARDLLTEAWKLHPEYPEAPQLMIGIANAGYAAHGDTPRLWFDRAVAAQMDYIPAYDSLFNAFLPRWGGSNDAMYRFGVECLKTHRFDTDVPWEFYSALYQIARDRKWDSTYWKKPEAVKYLQTMFDGYAKYGDPARADARKSCSVAAAWCGARYADARKALGELGSRVDTTIFPTYYYAPYELVRGEVFAYTGSCAKSVIRAEQLSKAGRSSDALRVYATILEKGNKEKEAFPYIRSRVARLQVDQKLARGEWVSLRPPANLDGWKKQGGEWTVKADGAVTGTSDGEGIVFWWDKGLGDRLEMKVEVGFDAECRGCTAGVFLDRSGQTQHLTGSVLLCHGVNRLVVYEGTKLFLDKTGVDVRDSNELVVRLWDDELTVSLNGVSVVKTAMGDQLFVPGKWRVGFYGKARPSQHITFRNLQVRQLKAEPDAPKLASTR